VSGHAGVIVSRFAVSESHRIHCEQVGVVHHAVGIVDKLLSHLLPEELLLKHQLQPAVAGPAGVDADEDILRDALGDQQVTQVDPVACGLQPCDSFKEIESHPRLILHPLFGLKVAVDLTLREQRLLGGGHRETVAGRGEEGQPRGGGVVDAQAGGEDRREVAAADSGLPS